MTFTTIKKNIKKKKSTITFFEELNNNILVYILIISLPLKDTNNRTRQVDASSLYETTLQEK